MISYWSPGHDRTYFACKCAGCSMLLDMSKEPSAQIAKDNEDTSHWSLLLKFYLNPTEVLSEINTNDFPGINHHPPLLSAMKISFATIFALFVATQASPFSLESGDELAVWAPTIVEPDATSVWTIGQEAMVVWYVISYKRKLALYLNLTSTNRNTSDAPETISNRPGIYLDTCMYTSHYLFRTCG